MIQLQIAHVCTHQVGIGEPGKFIGGGISRKRARLGDSLMDRGRRNVRSAGTPFAVIPVYRDADTAVICILEILHIAEARRRRQTHIVACADFGLIDAMPQRLLQCQLHELLEFLVPH
jgi:hypothetical protein